MVGCVFKFCALYKVTQISTVKVNLRRGNRGSLPEAWDQEELGSFFSQWTRLFCLRMATYSGIDIFVSPARLVSMGKVRADGMFSNMLTPRMKLNSSFVPPIYMSYYMTQEPKKQRSRYKNPDLGSEDLSLTMVLPLLICLRIPLPSL